MDKLFIFGDTHITPASFNTMEALENFAVYCLKEKPEYIINLGDVGDFDSVSRYVKDRGTFSTEQEFEAVEVAYSNFMKVFEDYNIVQGHKHRQRYKPTFIVCLGNHDVRSEEVCDKLTKFFTELGWIVIGHKRDISIHNILFSHSFTLGRTGGTCSNTKDILNDTLCSSVSAHGHCRELSEMKDRFGNRFSAIRIPCLNCDTPEWAGNTSLKWDRGWLELFADEKGINSFIFKDL